MAGLRPQQSAEFIRPWQRCAVLDDESSERTAITLAAKTAGKQRQMDIAPCFLPGAECSRGDIFFDALGRLTEPRILPIVNGSRAIRGQMCQPAARHHLFQN